MLGETKRKPIPKKDRLAVYEKYNGHCAYCGCKLELKDMQVDHLLPVCLGGTNSLDNYMPACRMCNFYKSTYPLEKFREQLDEIQSRLKREFIYRLALKHGLVEEVDKPIKFYFERREEK